MMFSRAKPRPAAVMSITSCPSVLIACGCHRLIMLKCVGLREYCMHAEEFSFFFALATYIVFII